VTAPDPVFGEGLVGEEYLPAAFVPRTLDAAAGERLVQRAVRLLAVDALLEEEPGDEDEDPRLARIEAKLGLALEMLGTLAAREALPDVLLRWSSQGVELPLDAPVAPGTAGVVRIALMPGLPLALELPGTVVRCDAGRAGIRYAHADEAFESALARRVFRAHRRAVAQARRQR
jgi:hypothetical protein